MVVFDFSPSIRKGGKKVFVTERILPKFEKKNMLQSAQCGKTRIFPEQHEKRVSAIVNIYPGYIRVTKEHSYI